MFSLGRFRKITKWGVGLVVVAFIITIFADWGARMSGWDPNPPALEVNGEDISFDLHDRVIGQRESQSGDLSDTARHELYVRTIDELISERLALQASKRLGLAATPTEIIEQTRTRLFTEENGVFNEQRYKAAKRDLPASEWTRYEKAFADDITLFKTYHFITAALVVSTDELRDYFNVRYQRARLRHILIRPGDFVPVEQARAFYAAHPDSFMVQERVKGRHILFPVQGGATPEQRTAALSQAEALLTRIRIGGEPFDRVFAQMKNDTSGRVIAQDLDWFSRGQMVPEFDTVAFTWPTRQITNIIATQFGYHIAVFDAHEMTKLQPFDEVSDGIRARLVGDSEIELARKRADDIHTRLNAGESFEALAREFSSGKSAANGGLLGDVTPGEMTPELYPDTGSLERIGREAGNINQGRVILDPAITRAVFELELNKISEVLTSGQGFHIVRIENRRGADPTVWEDYRERVDREYRDFLKRQVYNDWTMAMRRDADIEYSVTVKSRLE
jgi:parvulin-like peptidyl-prolyl isomerase